MERLEKENYEFLASMLLSRNAEGDHLCNTGIGRHREQNLYIYTSSKSNKQKNGQREFREKSIKQGFGP